MDALWQQSSGVSPLLRRHPDSHTRRMKCQAAAAHHILVHCTWYDAEVQDVGRQRKPLVLFLQAQTQSPADQRTVSLAPSFGALSPGVTGLSVLCDPVGVCGELKKKVRSLC